MTVPQTAEAARRAHLSPRATYYLAVVCLLAVAAGLTVATHEIYESVTAGNGVAVLDHPALEFAVAHRSPALTATAVTLTQLAGRIGNPALAVVALVGFTWRRRDRLAAELLVTGLLGSLLITVVGKRIIGRVRPPREFALPPFETSPSFPSGHTLNATVLAVLVAYLTLVTAQARWVRVCAVVGCAAFAVAVGLSRVYLGEHWLTDIMAGLLLGAAWASAVLLALRIRLRMHHRRRPHPAADPALGPTLNG